MSIDVIYSDVKFAKKGAKNHNPSCQNQDDVTYSEVKKGTSKSTGARSLQEDDVTYSTVTIAPAPRTAASSRSLKEDDVTYSTVTVSPAPQTKAGSQTKEPSSGISTVKILVIIGILIVVLVVVVIAIIFGINTKETTTTTSTSTNTTTTTSTTTTTTSTTTTTVSTCSTELHCDIDWELNGPKCYYFSTNHLSWIESETLCKTKGERLVKIDSREEQFFLYGKLRSLMKEGQDKFWIGLTDSETEGVWKWTDGSSLNPSLTFWFKAKTHSEPDNWTGRNNEYPEGEDCVRMGERTDNYQEKCWFDQNCNTPQRYICEKKPKQVCQ